MADLMIENLARCAGRTLVIGDVHGCLDELQSIVDQFAPTRKDRLLSVGDMINRGPDSAGTLRYARKIGLQSVLGNHEKKLLYARRSGDRSRLKASGWRTLKEISDKDWDWIESWPHIFNIPSLNSLVVHGGFIPGKSWKRQAPTDVTFVQVIDHRGHATKQSLNQNALPWADFWNGKKHVFYGHTPRPNPILHARCTGLDTGCVYGYYLTAVSLPDFTFFKEPARKCYVDG